jgi:hypothetical protein
MTVATARTAKNAKPAVDWLPRPLSWGCNLTPRGGGFPGHIHADHDEICLVANHGSIIRHGGVERPAEAGTVFLFRRGEFHGYRNLPDQEPNLWLVHYQADESLYADCPGLAAPDPEQRVWHLGPDELAGYQSLFARFLAESLHPHTPGHTAAMSGWLRLILIHASRWPHRRAGRTTAAPSPTGIVQPTAIAIDPDLAALWEIIHQHVEAPDDDFHSALRRHVPNYDSLRHRFKKVYGHAPRDLLQNLRIDRAKYLLLESDHPIGHIATQLGYGRPAEFARAFSRHVGQSPGAFRSNPLGGGSFPAA